MKNDPGFQLTVAVMATADAFLRESTRLFRPHGLTAAQYNVLNILGGAPSGMSQRELGDRLVVDRSNVTGLLDRLEKAGWVERTDHPDDRRIYQVSLTHEGHALWTRVSLLYLEVVGQITRELPVKRMNDCIAVLRQLETKASAWTFSPAPSPTTGAAKAATKFRSKVAPQK